MADESFKLPVSSYEELSKIIRGYGDRNNKESSIEDISHNTGIHKTVVSANNGFLISLGIIESLPKAKKVTENGRALALALQNDSEELIQLNWANLVQKNEFLQKILSAIRIRKGMDRATLITHILYTSGKKRDDKSVAGSGAIIEIFKISKLVEEKDEKIIAAQQELDSKKFDIFEFYNLPKPVVTELPLIQKQVSSIKSSESELPFQIKININCSVKEFDILIEKLHSLMSKKQADKREDDK